MLYINLVLLALFLIENGARAKRHNEPIRITLMRPSQIVIGYNIFFYALGACFFATENVLQSQYLVEADRWVLSTGVFYACTILIAIYATNRIRLPYRKTELLEQNKSTLWGFWGLAFVVLFILTGLEPILLFGTAFFFAASINYNTNKMVFYIPFIAATLIFLPLAADSKRLLIFPILIAILMLWRDQRIKGKYLLGMFALILLLILPMSIVRGYGSFNAISLFDAFQYIDDYVLSEYFLPSFGNNIEAVSFYFHGMNSLNMYLHTEPSVYGETLANMFFLGSSAYGFQDNLRSSIEIYTLEYDPAFRQIGGSFPIALVSEIVLNFHIWALILFSVTVLVLDGLYNLTFKFTKEVFRFSAQASLLYATLLLSRGASFDLFFYNIICLALPLYILPLTLRLRDQRRV